MSKLLLIDEITISDHHYLDLAEDKCYYFFNYTAQKGFSYSDCNNLILNFKKSLSYAGQSHFRYKDIAINRIANLLNTIGQDTINKSTFIPIPPSKSKKNPLYDDRLIKVLTRSVGNKDADIRELIIQSTDTIESHLSDDRRDVDRLKSILTIDETKAGNIREYIVVFDDVITTGCHFKAIKSLLNERFPNSTIIGLFIARREILCDFPDFVF